MRDVFRSLVTASFVVACMLVGAVRASALADASPEEKAAAKALIAGQKQAFKDFRAELAAASKALQADLVPIEQALADGGDADAQAELLFVTLVDLQAEVSDLAKMAAQAQADAAQLQLAALAPAIEGQYPAAFYPGDGTPTRGFEISVDQELTKVYAKLVKRLAKTLARFEQSGTLMTLRLLPPQRPARIWSTVFVDFFTTPTVSIDLALAWSAADSAGDCRLRVAGRAQTLQGFEHDVSLSATATVLDEVTVSVAPAAQRYSADIASDLLEGVYLLGATQADLAPAALSIGLR